jgi:hypothetical protein
MGVHQGDKQWDDGGEVDDGDGMLEVDDDML